MVPVGANAGKNMQGDRNRSPPSRLIPRLKTRSTSRKALARFPERAGADFFGAQRCQGAITSRLSNAQPASSSQLAQMQQVRGKIRFRLQRSDPRLLRRRHQHNAFGCPGFHEQVGRDEKRERECRHQRRTCELITNAHLGLFRIRLSQTTRKWRRGSYIVGKKRQQREGWMITRARPAARRAPPAAHAP